MDVGDKVNDERAAFEAWSKQAAPAYGYETDERGRYVEYPVDTAWAAWQAARRTPSASIGEDATQEMLDMLGRIHPFAMEKDDRAKAYERLERAYCIQQPWPVPDQACVVWRADLMDMRYDLTHKQAVFDSWKREREQKVAASIGEDGLPEPAHGIKQSEIDDMAFGYCPSGKIGELREFAYALLARKAETSALIAMANSLRAKRDAEIADLRAQLARQSQGLQTIALWELPATGKFWNDGKPISYEVEYGSNGAREFMRQVAFKALAAPPLSSEPQTKKGTTA